MDRERKLLSDDQLLELLMQGDADAFQSIYERYAPTLYNAIYNLLRDKPASEDLVHDLFVHLWIKRSQLKIKVLKSYLFIAVRNRVYTTLKKGRIHLDAAVLEKMANDYASDDRTIEKELQHLVCSEVDRLPEKCREIYNLSRNGQLSHREIASQLGISAKTVENQITIALKRLRPVLKDFLVVAGMLFFTTGK